MIAVGFVVLWAGYGIATWGYALLKGWNVPFVPWFDPVNTYQWPKPPDAPAQIPDTQVNPSPTPPEPHGKAQAG